MGLLPSVLVVAASGLIVWGLVRVAAALRGAEEVEGWETLKVFATTHATDFLPLLQTDYREGKEGPSGPVHSLDDLLAVTFGGGGYRDFRERPPGSEPEDWTVLSRTFLLRRAVVASREAGARLGRF